MNNQDQKALLDALSRQEATQKKVNKMLMIVLPIIGFMVCVMCANMSWQSTVGTFVMLTTALLAVGIKRWPIFIWLFLIAVYCLADNVLTYGTFATRPLQIQMGTMMVFTVITHMARPYLERLMTEKLI